MKAQNHRLVLFFLAGLGLQAAVHAADDGDIIIGREVPSRSAIRHGEPSPDVSAVNASQSDVIVGATQQVVSISGQAGEMVLGAVRGSVTDQTRLLQGLPVTVMTQRPLPVWAYQGRRAAGKDWLERVSASRCNPACNP